MKNFFFGVALRFAHHIVLISVVAATLSFFAVMVMAMESINDERRADDAYFVAEMVDRGCKVTSFAGAISLRAVWTCPDGQVYLGGYQ